MAQPKKKTSKSRTGSRRSQIHLELPALVYCDHCHALMTKHKICQNCGFYKGKEVLKK